MSIMWECYIPLFIYVLWIYVDDVIFFKEFGTNYCQKSILYSLRDATNPTH